MAQEADAEPNDTGKSKPLTKVAKWVEVKCAFCRGSGRDPFRLTSVLSDCPACGGVGTVRVRQPYVTCRACNGTGVQPFTRVPCLACGGKGVSHVEEPTETCPVCRGKGVNGLHLYCLRCHGAGMISKQTRSGGKAKTEL